MEAVGEVRLQLEGGEVQEHGTTHRRSKAMMIHGEVTLTRPRKLTITITLEPGVQRQLPTTGPGAARVAVEEPPR